MLNDQDTTFYNLPFKLDYEYIKTPEEAFKSFEYFDKFNTMGVDTETNGLDPYNNSVILLQLALPNGKVFVYDLRYIPGELFRVLLEDDGFLHILQNAVFDYKMMKANYGITINRMYDTMIAERCINLGLLNMPANLGHLVYKYLNYRIDKDVAAEFCDGTMTELTNRQIQYAAHDAACLFGIVKAQSQVISGNKLNNVCKLEFEFSPCMADMELAGVLLDQDKWRVIIKETEEELNALVKDVLPAIAPGVNQIGLFGEPAINLCSNVKLLACLNNLGLGLENTSVGSLQLCQHKHEAVPMLLKYRQLEKLLSSFGETILAKIHAQTGRLHPTYNQMVSTGRLSCRAPNLQQIPGKSSFRSCFVAKPGYKMVTNDMSQAELRILACYSKDPVFIDAYLQGKDLHIATACGVYGLTEEEVVADNDLPDGHPDKRDYRKNTKSINFGLCVCNHSTIFTNSGIKEIKDSVVGDVVAHDIGNNKIIDKQYKGEKEVFEIKTKYGYTLEVTEDHQVKVIDGEGNYIDKKLKDVDINTDQACLKSGSNLFVDKLYEFCDFSIKRISNYKHLELPKVLDENWAAFLGLFVSEGSMPVRKNKKQSWLVEFGFSKKEPDILNSVYKLLYLLFKDRLSINNSRKNEIKYSISSSLLAAWVKSLFNFTDDKTSNIHIPDCIKRSPKKIQISFIKWVFEGDGSIANNQNGVRIRYASVSYTLVKDLQLLLLNMGIIGAISYHYDKRCPGKKFYDLAIVSDNSRRVFMKHIGFVTNHKNNKCSSKVGYIHPFYNVNNQINRLKNIKHNKAIKHLYGDIALGRVNSTHLKEFSKHDDFFKFIYDNNIITLPIVSIKSKGIKPVYDISIENRELFLANGFIVHNCYGMSKYGLAARLGISEDVAEDMIDKYFQSYPGVKRYLDRAAKDAVNKGYSTTISGRRRYYTLPGVEVSADDRKKHLNSIKRKGKNTSIQGCFVHNTNVFGAGLIGENVDKTRILSAGKEGNITAIGQYSGKQRVYKLITAMGFTLEGTFDHPITVKGTEYNQDIMMSLGETKGMQARMVSGKYKGFPINIENVIKKFRVITKNNYITPELGFILGCLYDSGYFESRQKLFYINNKVITDKLVESCSKHFRSLGNLSKYNPIKFMNKGSKVFINFHESIKNLLYYLLYDSVGRVGHISYILNSPVEVRKSFVSGFLGCRSRVDEEKQRMAILCSNDTVAFTVQQMLLSLGVISFKEDGVDGDCQLGILDDFVTNVGKLIDGYGFGLDLFTPMPDLEFYDEIKSIERCEIKDTYDFVSGDEPHMYIANGFKVSNSNADVLKKAIINISKNIKKEGYDAETVLNIHDEVVVEVREDQAEEVAATVSKSMIDAWDYFFTDVPMVAKSSVDYCWNK
jgi:DNA polymerase-1